MGVFPKKILLATDGSEEAELATRTATEPAEKTGSELHVVYAQPIPLPVGPRPDDPFLDIIGPYASEVIKDIKEKAQRLLDAQVQQVRAVGRRSVSPSEDRRSRRRDCRLSRRDGGRADTAGEPRTGRSRRP
jgi:nucleotide-binding universal stress UspA family protein